MRVRLPPRASTMIRHARGTAWFAALVVAHAGLATAQDPPPALTLRGAVVSAETREPLAFSIVALIPVFGQRFTDDRGVFAFDGLVPGTYRLLVRQIGYTQLDTTFVVGRGTSPSLLVALRRLAVELPPITVAGEATCVRAGRPDKDLNPALAAVFDELLENARRFELLADSYPFRYRFERTFRSATRAGDSLPAQVDTLEQASGESRRRYRPGRVIDAGTGPFRGWRTVSLLTLREFGDSTFIRHHCFRLAGRDTIEGQALLRVDFEPAAHLRSPDLEGAAYLDSLTYQIRYTRVALTRAPRALRGVVALVATTRFEEIVPGIVLHRLVRAVTTYRPPPRRSERPAVRVETQRLLGVRFDRPFVRTP